MFSLSHPTMQDVPFYGCLLHRFQDRIPIHGSRSHLTKLRTKGITGRLWRSIDGLYQNMQSKLLHPNIPDDDYFKIEVSAREGLVLKPILVLTAVDDMLEPYSTPCPPPPQSAEERKRARSGSLGWRIVRSDVGELS